jgi:hypothetical protein
LLLLLLVCWWSYLEVGAEWSLNTLLLLRLLWWVLSALNALQFSNVEAALVNEKLYVHGGAIHVQCDDSRSEVVFFRCNFVFCEK